MELRYQSQCINVSPQQPYHSSRLLVGQFSPAVDCLKNGIHQLGLGKFWQRRPNMELHACELSQGGLSEVEVRCLTELGLAAGAYRVEVHQGASELS